MKTGRLMGLFFDGGVVTEASFCTGSRIEKRLISISIETGRMLP